jgi:hydroxymethylpyrimidine pyrophosphatase-like HAD family hydrolase
MGTGRTPLVIVLDIDGTIIGDINPQVVSYEIVNELKRRKEKISLDQQDFITKLKSGIVRPHFDSFMNELQNYGVEFFIYTASEKRWAEYLVKKIEQAYNIKFNRPIFTRNHCFFVDKDFKKSLKTIKPAIFRTLKKKYAEMTLGSLRDNIMVVDNRAVYSSTDNKSILICPTYNYKIPENLPVVLKQNVFARHYQPIMETLIKYDIISRPTKYYINFQKQFYQRYVDDLTHLTSAKEELHDNFFKQLTELITGKGIRIFDERVVSYLTKKMNLTTPESFVNSSFKSPARRISKGHSKDTRTQGHKDTRAK